MKKRKIYALMILFIGFVLSACASSTPQTTLASKKLSSNFPLHFLGLIPGANCTNQYQLDLLENRTYFLRNVCFKDGVASKNSDDIGRWYIDAENRVVLNGTKKRATYFQILDAKSIELMDLKGEKIVSDLNYKLEVSMRAKTIEPKLQMMGMYSYMADAATFYECSTGLKLPVVFEEDNLALERAYTQSGAPSGTSLKVHVEAKIVQRKAMDRAYKESALVVSKFINLLPKELCQNPYSKAKLTETYWKLTRVDSKIVPFSKNNRREAHMILKADGKIRAHSGCNSMNGAYQLDGDKLSLKGGMMMTRMFCKNSLEREFSIALQRMVRYKIVGEYLEIFDKDGNNLARFESVYM